jgi:hypothetical protein
MAVTLGFILIFAAGMAGAYFAGVQAAKSRSPTAPGYSRDTRDFEADPDSEASAVSSSTETNRAAGVAAEPRDSAEDESCGEVEADEQEFYADTRRFKRLAFSGTALATIYPPKSRPSAVPFRCEVLTRDLSCNGIGIAHTERLLPQQMVVLEALGKLLVSEVRWCQRVDKGLYIVGCRLIKAT